MNRVRTVGALLLTLFAIACAARSRSVDPAIGTPGQPGVTTAGEQTGAVEALPEAGPGSRVTSIAAHASETGTIVTISGTQPLSYTSFDPDATTLVLEMPDTDVSSLQPVIEVNTPQLSRIKMPRLFDFRPELPREANGKLYKRELRDEYAARAAAEIA